jgi:SpoVK/Ycf46/Vps4 family AAA+-type ATPase
MLQNSFLARDVALEKLSEVTKNFSGAEIEGLVKDAVAYALNRQVRALIKCAWDLVWRCLCSPSTVVLCFLAPCVMCCFSSEMSNGDVFVFPRCTLIVCSCM